MKILPKINGTHRLITTGTVSDAILHDEDFVEVHKKRSFAPADLEEIRVPPEDEMLQQRISKRFMRGILPTPTELLWISRRLLIEKKLQQQDINIRVVVSTGRGNRWG
jgi:hypothetical protein